jgi:hypothetical protein
MEHFMEVPDSEERFGRAAGSPLTSESASRALRAPRE